jgi:hypothetical protein
MEERFGVKGTLAGGVFFSESSIAGAPVMKHISVEISRQNANLGQVKDRLAADARALGATAVMNFRYGQKAHPWWQLYAFKWDTESWHGEGDAVAPRQ